MDPVLISFVFLQVRSCLKSSRGGDHLSMTLTKKDTVGCGMGCSMPRMFTVSIPVRDDSETSFFVTAAAAAQEMDDLKDPVSYHSSSLEVASVLHHQNNNNNNNNNNSNKSKPRELSWL